MVKLMDRKIYFFVNCKWRHHGYLDGEKDRDASKKGGDRGGGPSYARQRTLKNLNIYR